MSESNIGVLISGPGGKGLPGKTKIPKGYLALWQGVLLIFLTIAFTTTGWYFAGEYYFWNQLDSKRIEEQLTYLESQVRADPKKLDVRVALGYTHFLKGNNEQAVKELNQVLDLDKNYYDAYYNLGLVYRDEGRLDDALEVLQKAVEISPRDFKGYVQQGIVYRELNMYKEAMASLDKANKLSPRNADIIYQIGLVAEDKGDKKLAASIFKDALKYDPLFKDAANALERVQ